MSKNIPSFAYQSEKLSQARRILMAPNPHGEEQSFADAFFECSRAFHEFDEDLITDGNAQNWIDTIKQLMDTSGVEDPTDEGTYLHRARAMTLDEKCEFSRCIAELASWFTMKFWSKD